MEKVEKPIEVVHTADSAGLIKPLYFYIEDEKPAQAYVIERIIRRDLEKINGDPVTTFTAELILNNHRILCDLRFNEKTSQWILYRI
jgi:hypothetical protein